MPAMPARAAPAAAAAADPAPAAVAGPAPDSFEAFYRQHHRAVVALACSMTGDWAVAEEVTQDAFVKAYARWDQIRSHPRPDLWIRRVALNGSTSFFRRKGAERRATARSQSLAVVAERSGPPTAPAGAGWLVDHIRRLPRQQAQAMALVHLEQLDHAEAAEVLGCAESTVRSHLHRGRRALQDAIAREDRHDR
jgi:RNA polymerase sigma-70 factor (ECF subfamily)